MPMEMTHLAMSSAKSMPSDTYKKDLFEHNASSLTNQFNVSGSCKVLTVQCLLNKVKGTFPLKTANIREPVTFGPKLEINDIFHQKP